MAGGSGAAPIEERDVDNVHQFIENALDLVLKVTSCRMSLHRAPTAH